MARGCVVVNMNFNFSTKVKFLIKGKDWTSWEEIRVIYPTKPPACMQCSFYGHWDGEWSHSEGRRTPQLQYHIRSEGRMIPAEDTIQGDDWPTPPLPPLGRMEGGCTRKDWRKIQIQTNVWRSEKNKWWAQGPSTVMTNPRTISLQALIAQLPWTICHRKG